MSYRPQLCTHTPLSYFHCRGSEVKAPSESQVCSESCQHKCWKPARDALLCPSRMQGSGALPSPDSCRVTQQLNTGTLVGVDPWCRHVVRNLADCSVKSLTTDGDFIPPLLLLAAFAAVVNLVPVTLSYTDSQKQWSGLELLPTACAEKFSCTISNCIYFRPVV